jgi:hypothetical protein
VAARVIYYGTWLDGEKRWIWKCDECGTESRTSWWMVSLAYRAAEGHNRRRHNEAPVLGGVHSQRKECAYKFPHRMGGVWGRKCSRLVDETDPDAEFCWQH